MANVSVSLSWLSSIGVSGLITSCFAKSVLSSGCHSFSALAAISPGKGGPFYNCAASLCEHVCSGEEGFLGGGGGAHTEASIQPLSLQGQLIWTHMDSTGMEVSTLRALWDEGLPLPYLRSLLP